MSEIKCPKLLAIYLPQFYENEDNNLWWGKGFTEWQSVKTAEQYFPGHNEPRIPISSNYYDLSQKESIIEQVRLASQYGIDGFCFYHYYFKNGKKELELPAENLLNWKEINMSFCFNWANSPWIRSWSRINGNVWSEKYEKEEGGGESVNGVLVEQDYGTIQEWEQHFEYLLPFFKDDRYIKIDGKPVFIFHNPDEIFCLPEMTAYWRDLAKQAGFPGLHLIGSHLKAPSGCLDAAIIFEPRNSINHLNDSGKMVMKNRVRCFDYEDICEEVLDASPIFEYKTYFCGVCGYDDTPRRGRSGECLINRSPEMFEQQLVKLIQKSIISGNELLFINAWNEWGEGMYLEPDEMDKYSYLEAVKNAVSMASRAEGVFHDINHIEAIKKEISTLNYDVKKFKRLFNILDKWLFLQQESQPNFLAFFVSEKISSVAIYGMASLGKHLLIQLRKENVNVVFGIDRYVGQFGNDYTIYRPEDEFPNVDAIIITAYDTASISESLRHKYRGRIFSLEEIIDAMMRG